MLIISIVDLLNYHKIMNRQYEFIQTVFEPIERTTYFETYETHLKKTQSALSNLNASESYSVKLIHAGGKNFFGGFFVDRSGIRRPDSMPVGESWNYKQFWFKSQKEMFDQLNELLTCLNKPDYLQKTDKEIKFALSDAQIYYSKIEFDLYRERGMWNFWYKV